MSTPRLHLMLINQELKLGHYTEKEILGHAKDSAFRYILYSEQAELEELSLWAIRSINKITPFHFDFLTGMAIGKKKELITKRGKDIVKLLKQVN